MLTTIKNNNETPKLSHFYIVKMRMGSKIQFEMRMAANALDT